MIIFLSSIIVIVYKFFFVPHALGNLGIGRIFPRSIYQEKLGLCPFAADKKGMKMLQKIFTISRSQSLSKKKEALFRKITTIEENAWILENRYTRQSFWLLIESMQTNHVNFFLKCPPLLFLKTSGTLASSVHQHKSHHLILIYPDTYKLLSGLSFEKGVAILAHELGHLFHEHAKKKLTPLQAQVQADEFACLLGFGEELQEVLLEHDDLIECRVRVSYITSLLISNGALAEKKLAA